ncbi:MAG: hybrid sensor histidine kinase/response regulator [Candidatus Ventricola sp.]
MSKTNTPKKRILPPILAMVVMGIGVLFAFRSYNSYLDELIYQEQLNQMSEVTQELYSSMDMLMRHEWETAQFIRDWMICDPPQTMDQLTTYLKTLQSIYQAGASPITPIVIDSSGRYYSSAGKKGVIYNIEALADCTDRVSSVTNVFGTNTTDILFIYKLAEPILVQDTPILYCGYLQDLSVLIDCYHTDAFSGQSTAYVMNSTGTKLYSTSSEYSNRVFVGRNIYSILADMTYTHGNSYASLMSALSATGNSIANASLDGTEYYLCLHRMRDTDWVLLLVIPAQYVATNTQLLVDSVINTLVYAGFGLVAIFIVILAIIMKMIQQEQLYQQEQANSAKLEVARQEAEAARQAAEEAFKIAEAANSSKSAFLSNMSHDIRTPMNAIVGFSALLSKDAGHPDKVLEYAKKISASSQHLLGLINDVLDMSRIESGKTTLNLSEASITSIAEEVDTIIRPQMIAKGHTFDVDVRGVVHDAIVVDKVRLNQICINLLSNAVKYTPDKGHVRFKVSERSLSGSTAHYEIVVSDNGYGMSEAFRQHIFDSFSREEDSRTSKIQGTGLGMAITKNLVDLMGGTIRVESRKGAGSTFTVDIPFQISQAQSASPSAAETPDHGEDAHASSVLSGKRILVAEDNELNAEILTALLDLAGATFDVCENGELAVAAFRRSAPGAYDLILMDVQMPVMNGYEATGAIRQSGHPQARSIPIIAMTANAFTEDIRDALKAGMNAHVAKPVDMDILEETVRSVLSADGPDNARR